MKKLIFMLPFLLGIFCLSCGNNEEKKQNVTTEKQEPDSVRLMPLDLNNTLFMMHYNTVTLLDSMFFAPPEQVRKIYETLIFELELKISDLEKMQFSFEYSKEFIRATVILFTAYHRILKNEFEPLIELLEKEEMLTKEEKDKIQAFETSFESRIQPRVNRFLEAQDKFAQKHKIELIDY